MTPADALPGPTSGAPLADAESRAWIEGLKSRGDQRDAAIAELHALMIRMARAEALRRSGWHGIRGAELDDIAHQAADDAVVSILRKVADFRGDSRFTTWACKFVIHEVSSKFGRHVWRRDGVQLDDQDWNRLPAHLGGSPEAIAQSNELADALREGIANELTPHQRHVFVAIAIRGTPLDAIVVELDTNRNAIYKTMFDARRKLRGYLVERGYLHDEAGRA